MSEQVPSDDGEMPDGGVVEADAGTSGDPHDPAGETRGSAVEDLDPPVGRGDASDDTTTIGETGDASSEQPAGDASSEQPTNDAPPRVCWLDDDDAAAVIGALSSETARSIVTALQTRPRTASELAEAVDTSVQNVRHHLDNLRDAELVSVAGTRYSVKGREMTVYTASDERVLVAVGSNEQSDSLLDSLRAWLGALAAVGVASAFVQWTLDTTTTAVTRVPDSTATEPLAAPVPPGLLVFGGGVLAVAVIALVATLR